MAENQPQLASSVKRWPPPLASTKADQLWEWDAAQATWLERTPSAGQARPAGRTGHVLVYDESRGTIVLVGGAAQGVGAFADLWQWNGAPGAP